MPHFIFTVIIGEKRYFPGEHEIIITIIWRKKVNSIEGCVLCVYLLYWQTHHMQCPAEPRMFPSIDCNIFNHPKPMTMALSVLVVIEMLNAMNR